MNINKNDVKVNQYIASLSDTGIKNYDDLLFFN